MIEYKAFKWWCIVLEFVDILTLLKGVKRVGSGYIAKCPAHDDKKASLSVGQGDDGRILLYCHAGCSIEEVVTELGIDMKELYPTNEAGKMLSNNTSTIVKVYDYRDAAGNLVYQVVRYEPKGFRQRRPDGHGGWIWNMVGITPLPYRLPELLAAIKRGDTVFVAEGERDANMLAALGLAATCNHGGAGKWKESHTKWFPKGARVVVLPDNDGPGRDHAAKVAAQLSKSGCDVRVVELPGLPEKGDVLNWLDAGGTKEVLLRLVAEEPIEQIGKTLKIVCLADVEPEEVYWLWRPYIPKGKITLLEGDPAAGKTFIALAVAAAVSTGGPLPDGNTGRAWERREPGNVIYLTAEDGIGDTLRPRLDAMGANVANIYALSSTVDKVSEDIFTFSDMAMLDGLAATLNPQLIVIDPLQAFLGAGVDMHRANETRPILLKLAALAERNGCAILLLRHLSKAGTTKSIYRGMGSIDFTAAARSVLLAGCDPQDQRIRAIVHIKSSLAPTGQAQGYELGGEFRWTGISSMTANTMFSNEAATDEQKNKLNNAAEWLESQLIEPREKREIIELADDKGISRKTLRRAAEKLGVKSYKPKGEKNAPWIWELLLNNSHDGVAQHGQVVEFPQGYTMGNTSTRENINNNNVSTSCPYNEDGQDVNHNNITCCPSLFIGQDVEVNNGAENELVDVLPKPYHWTNQPEGQADGQVVDKNPSNLYQQVTLPDGWGN